MWIFLAIASAVCLGFYDISKKQSLRGNSVPLVLLLSIVCSSLLLLPLLLLSRFCPDLMQGTLFFVPQVDGHTHLLLFLKALLVLSSWIFAYIAMKHLPITLVSPINATRPMWTLLGAVLIFAETLNAWQWSGVGIALVSFFCFSLVGQKEGIRFTHNRYIYALLLATFLGAASGLYDKYLMRTLDVMAVQVYYTLYQALLMAVVCLVLYGIEKRKDQHFHPAFRFTGWIICISVFLVLSDFVYLLALSDKSSLISVVSLVRRSGVIIPFLYGAIFLHDQNIGRKALCLLGVLVGMLCLLMGTL